MMSSESESERGRTVSVSEPSCQRHTSSCMSIQYCTPAAGSLIRDTG